MRSKMQNLSMLVGLMLVCGIGWISYGQKQQTTRVTWEYKQTTGGEFQINELGSQGWELVSVVYNPGAHTEIFYLKRAK